MAKDKGYRYILPYCVVHFFAFRSFLTPSGPDASPCPKTAGPPSINPARRPAKSKPTQVRRRCDKPDDRGNGGGYALVGWIVGHVRPCPFLLMRVRQNTPGVKKGNPKG